MKKIFKTLLIISLIGLCIYAIYLCYVKFVKESADDEWIDLEDTDEAAPEISFADRVKAAAERQIKKAR